MKKYEFNESGVCTNPDIAFDMQTIYPSSKISLKIEVGSNNAGLWDFGYSYAYSTGGGGTAVSFNNEYRLRIFHNSKKEAVIKCIDYFLGHDYGIPKKEKEVLKDFKNTLLHEQLSLF